MPSLEPTVKFAPLKMNHWMFRFLLYLQHHSILCTYRIENYRDREST
jgi:hypothetical protein